MGWTKPIPRRPAIRLRIALGCCLGLAHLVGVAGPARADHGVCTIEGAGQITGTDGDDVICGSSGADWIYAGAGNDVIIASGWTDQVYGEAGNDELDFSHQSTAVRIIFGQASSEGRTSYDGIEKIRATPFNDVIRGYGDVAETILGLGGDDSIDGGPGNDHLEGGLGVDTLNYQSEWDAPD